jgi:hypothetical protein
MQFPRMRAGRPSSSHRLAARNKRSAAQAMGLVAFDDLNFESCVGFRQSPPAHSERQGVIDAMSECTGGKLGRRHSGSILS